MSNEKMSINFKLLGERVLESLDKSDLEGLMRMLKSIKGPTICVGVGGSSVVSQFASRVLSCKNNIIACNKNARDLMSMNLTPFSNVLSCSYSGSNFGVEVAFDNELNHYLLSSKENIGNTPYYSAHEKSFISLAATLIPMAILLNYYLDGNDEVIREILQITPSFGFEESQIWEVMSGMDSSTAARFLETTLIESGIAIPIVHDKYDYCHGRSTTSFKGDNNIVLFNKDTDLDKIFLMEFPKYYKSIVKLDSMYDDTIVDDFYLTYQSMYLAKEIAKENGEDLSDCCHSPITKKLYHFSGKM